MTRLSHFAQQCSSLPITAMGTELDLNKQSLNDRMKKMIIHVHEGKKIKMKVKSIKYKYYTSIMWLVCCNCYFNVFLFTFIRMNLDLKAHMELCKKQSRDKNESSVLTP